MRVQVHLKCVVNSYQQRYPVHETLVFLSLTDLAPYGSAVQSYILFAHLLS